MDSYIEGEDNGLNRLLDNFAKIVVHRLYKPDVEDLTFEFNLRSTNDDKPTEEIGDNEFVLTIFDKIPLAKLKITDGLPKERADRLIALTEKYFANKDDTIVATNDGTDYIFAEAMFDFEKYKIGFIEQLKDILDNFLQQKKFEFETVKSNKGVVITVKPDYYNLDFSKAHMNKTLANFILKMDFLHDDNTYLSFATDIISSMRSYMTGASSGRIKGDYELKIPIHYNASRLGCGLTRDGDSLEIRGRALYEGFTKQTNSYTNYFELIFNYSDYQIAFEDNCDYSWYYNDDKAKWTEGFAVFKLMYLIEAYCHKNHIPAKLDDKDGLKIVINNADVTE